MVPDGEGRRGRVGRLALERVDHAPQPPLVQPEPGLDRVRHDPGEGAGHGRHGHEPAREAEHQRRRGGRREDAVPQAAEPGAEREGRDRRLLGHGGRERGAERHRAGDELLQGDGAGAERQERRGDLGRGGAGAGVGAHRLAEPAAEVRVVAAPPDRRQPLEGEGLDAGVGQDRLGERVARRHALALPEGELEELGHDQPFGPRGDPRPEQEVPGAEPRRRAPGAERARRGRGRQQPDLGHREGEVDRRPDDVPAERLAVQRDGAPEREVLGHERLDAPAPRREVAAHPVLDRRPRQIALRRVASRRGRRGLRRRPRGLAAVLRASPRSRGRPGAAAEGRRGSAGTVAQATPPRAAGRRPLRRVADEARWAVAELKSAPSVRAPPETRRPLRLLRRLEPLHLPLAAPGRPVGDAMGRAVRRSTIAAGPSRWRPPCQCRRFCQPSCQLRSFGP